MIDHPVPSDEQRTPPRADADADADADAAERGLELRREHKRGDTEVGV